MNVAVVRQGRDGRGIQGISFEGGRAVVHAPLTDATRGRFGAAELASLPRGAILVNTARGPIVDEEALVAALSLEASFRRGPRRVSAGADDPSRAARAPERRPPPAPRLGHDRDAPRDGAPRVRGDRALRARRAAAPPRAAGLDGARITSRAGTPRTSSRSLPKQPSPWPSREAFLSTSVLAVRSPDDLLLLGVGELDDERADGHDR